ncbi:peptidoglycan-binding protein [Roseibium album]|uniref:Uncharacterized protein n=1 Tax=Roseibium album TaxID=311410 RepID=A0A0M6ZN40_9HYPH|nr:peptidoglycan-binding protein [Roseibium album]CTQ58902.1 hypothetical protein LA5094_01663 [Roseibium album]CTQ63642.1 hypothetical protein LA5096_00086 [Roseibium album]CTQ73232.1 hypothetical protein LA5095_02717 [Roseibium album]
MPDFDGPKYWPLLKNYTESFTVEVLQNNLNMIAKVQNLQKHYSPSGKALSKMGHKTFSDLKDSDLLLETDGKYGRLTAGRVVIFQDNFKLPTIDGIVGTKETWPALDHAMMAVEREILRAALNNRPNLINAKQTLPGGADCGYFAGYAVAATENSSFGPTSISFDRDDALAARDKFDETIDEKDHGKENTGKDLHVLDAARYLESLGASGFRLRDMTSGNFATENKLIEFLDERTNAGRSPAMVALNNVISPSIGHWVAVLGKNKVLGITLYLIYDSSGRLPKVMKGAGSIAGVTCVWVDEFVLRAFFDDRSASRIVSRF